MSLARVALLLLMAATPLRPQPFKLVTVEPGHFHAALIQKEQLPDLAREAFVYAELSPDLTAHLNRIAQFNSRKNNPTDWRLRIYGAPDYWERMLADRPGQIVVLSGRNRGKMDRVGSLVRAGLHGLIDKPWVIESEDLPKLEATLKDAKARGVVVYDGMTQRYEITCLLQKELVNDAAIFGTPVPGSLDNPSVTMDSVHYLLKTVAGVPNRRPPWFFDIREQGEGLTDVGTHLVDLVQWTLSSARTIDYAKDIRVLRGTRSPTVLSRDDFARVTGEGEFPDYLRDQVRADGLQYYCNNSVDYTLRGVHVRLDVKWGFEAKPGSGDSETAVFRGTRSSVEVRDNEVWVVPKNGTMLAAVKSKVAALQPTWPGLAVEQKGDRIHVIVPPALRIGHEAHFALLVKQFLQYVKAPKTLPDWETSFLLAKYYVTTQAVAMARHAKP